MDNYNFKYKVFKIDIYDNKYNKSIHRTIKKINNYGHLLNYINLILNDNKNYNLKRIQINEEEDIINNELYNILNTDIKNKKKIISY